MSGAPTPESPVSTTPPPPMAGPGGPEVGSPAATPTGTVAAVRFPEVWSRRHDLPGLPWSIAKGITKGIVLIFFAVLLPIEILYVYFGASDLRIHHGITVALLTYGGGALAVTSAGFTAFQTTRAYGFFRMANRVTKLIYQYILATAAIFTFGPYLITYAGLTASLGIRIDVADIFYLFMIPTTFAVLAAFVTLYEDARHPGERLPWDFPISRRTRRRREREMADYLRVPPPP